MTETYWQWLKQGIKSIKDNNLAKSIIFLLVGSCATVNISIGIIICNFLVGIIVGFVLYFFTITYTIYLAEK